MSTHHREAVYLEGHAEGSFATVDVLEEVDFVSVVLLQDRAKGLVVKYGRVTHRRWVEFPQGSSPGNI